MREAATLCPHLPVTLTFDLESGVRVTCDVGYLCDNFSLPPIGLSVLNLGQMYATDVRQHHRLMPRLGGRGHNNIIMLWLNC